jgi:hypothetical protein
MNIDGCEFVVDSATKFYRHLHVSGWFHHNDERLVSIELHHHDIIAFNFQVGLQYAGVETTRGPCLGFQIDGLMKSSVFPDNAIVTFVTDTGRRVEASLEAMRLDRIVRMRSSAIFRTFRANVLQAPDARLLSIGGRDRSASGGLPGFGDAQVTVLDIVPADGVDVVGDAHDMGRLFEPDSFDFVFCSSVFEHLIMPWRVVLEINQILKPGGLVFISTHQTIGLHDVPWDFFRFSDAAYDGLFNHATGFEIIDRQGDFNSFIVPGLFRPGKEDAEGAVGHEASVVLARKIGPTKLRWDVTASELLAGNYPL